jgi:hypothetical protein
MIDATTPTKTRRHFVGTVKNPTPLQFHNRNVSWLRTSWSGVRISLGVPLKTPVKQGFLAKIAPIVTAKASVVQCAQLCRNVRERVLVVRRAFVGQYAGICAEFSPGRTAPRTSNHPREITRRQLFPAVTPECSASPRRTGNL